MSAFDDWEMTYIEQGEYGNYTYSDMSAAFNAGMERAAYIKPVDFNKHAGNPDTYPLGYCEGCWDYMNAIRKEIE
jgi:hypothetical protein